MELKQCIFTQNRCYKQGVKMTGGVPTGIVVHSTGANNKTLKRYVQPVKGQDCYDAVMADLGKNLYGNHWNMDTPGGRSVCMHGFIGVNAAGKVETYQTLPFDICCWGVGAIPYDKNGKELASASSKAFDHYGPSYNYNPQARVQFEICEDGLTDAAYFAAAMQEAQEFCAYLCKKYGFGADKICSHHEAYLQGYGGNHGDPDHWLKKFGKDMDWFRAEVQKLLDSEKKPEPVSPVSDFIYRVQVGAYRNKDNARDLVAKLAEAGFNAFIADGAPAATDAIPTAADYEELADKYRTLEARVQAFRGQVLTAVEQYDNGAHE